MKETLARLGLMVLVTWAAMEAAACAVGRQLIDRGLFYDDRHDFAGFDTWLAERDPLLSWPRSSDWSDGTFDAIHSRIVPASPDVTAKPCVSIYGDSFAWGDEVDAEHAWGNVLAQRAHCRVNNFGVGGYGSDQAYLRFTQNKDDKAPAVILTHLSENVLRNVNRFRNLLAPHSRYGFKPRFVANDAGEITLLPMPVPRSLDELRIYVKTPEKILDNDWFVPGGPAGVTRFEFPYLVSIVKDLSSYKLKAGFAGVPPHAAFYEPTHPAHGLQVSAGIARAFQKDAMARGMKPYFVIIPLPADFEFKKKKGKWPYEPLLDELKKSGVPYVDMGERLSTYLDGKSPCTLYIRCSGGHFNNDGYRVLGEQVQAYLQEQGALPK